MDRAKHYKNIYQTKAQDYDVLTSKEDYQGNLLPALSQITPLSGANIVEIGAGTGRFTCLLSPLAKHITAFDESESMLDIAKTKLKNRNLKNCELIVAKNQMLPIQNQIADLCLAGWTLGHLRHWFPDTWKEELELALSELKRVCKVGGAIIIIESLGIATETIAILKPVVAEFNSILEKKHGFKCQSIRTDFYFSSTEEAYEICSNFFGKEIAEKIKQSNSVIVPEITGIWSLKI